MHDSIKWKMKKWILLIIVVVIGVKMVCADNMLIDSGGTQDLIIYPYFSGELGFFNSGYCGDKVCNLLESCSSCSRDCGDCEIKKKADAQGGGLTYVRKQEEEQGLNYTYKITIDLLEKRYRPGQNVSVRINLFNVLYEKEIPIQLYILSSKNQIISYKNFTLRNISACMVENGECLEPSYTLVEQLNIPRNTTREELNLVLESGNNVYFTKLPMMMNIAVAILIALCLITIVIHQFYLNGIEEQEGEKHEKVD